MTTRAPDRPTPAATPLGAADDQPRRRAKPVRPRIDLSATQLIATAFAAITATVAASFLGVTGTVIGAALASVLTAAGNAIYGTSLRHTRDRVRAAVPAGRRRVPMAGDDSPRPRPGSGADSSAPTLPAPAPRVRPVSADRQASRWRAVAIGSITVFVAVVALVTGVEIVAGRPLADVVRGDSGSGTSLFGGTGGGSGTSRTVPGPTTTVTVTPSIKVVTPTVTTTGPAKTVTSTPTTTVTPTTPQTSTGSGSRSAPASSSSSNSAPTLP